MRKTLLKAALLAVVPASVSFGQSTSPSAPDIGLQAYHDYHGGDIDHVSVDNGNLTLTIPIVSYPQRGNALKVDFPVVYNGTGKTYYETCFGPPQSQTCITTWSSNIGTNGSLNPFTTAGGPALFDSQDMSAATKSVPSRVQLQGYTNPYYDQRVWYTADGGAHYAFQTSTGQISQDGTNIQAGFLWAAGVDPGGQSTCSWDCSLSGALADSSVMATRGGITYFGSSSEAIGPVRMDMEGNYISSNGTALTDTVGRSIPFPTVVSSPTQAELATCSASLPSGFSALPVTSVNVWTPPGYTQPFTFCYVTITESTPVITVAPHLTSTVMGHPTQTVLQSLVLPNGQAWTFGYTESITNCPYYATLGATNIGDLTHITFPTGGTIDYTYTCNEVLPSGTRTTSVASRTVTDGTGPHEWTYSYLNGETGTTTITDPVGNQTVDSVTSTSRTVTQYSGSASGGTLLRTDARAYFSQYQVDLFLGFTYPLYLSSETKTLENGLSTQTVYQICCNFTFDGTILPQTPPAAASYGKVTDMKVYDYTTGSQGALLKETANSYLFESNSNYMNPGLFDLVSLQTIYDGSGNQDAQTTYSYDQTSLVTSGITTQKTPPIYGTGVYGLQTSKAAWLNTGPSNPTSTASYYDTGEVYQSFDPLNHSTTYQYSGTYVGALPTSVTNALNQATTYTYRTDTGQKLTVTDPNSQTTTYSYINPSTGVDDYLNRLTSISYPDGGLTSIQYNDTGNIGVTVTDKITSSLNKQTQLIVDGLGRTSETILLSDPSGPTYTLETYDALGRKYQVWNPTRCTPTTTPCSGETTWGITTYNYDAISREILEIPPDGSSSGDNEKTSYSGNSTTVTDEAGNVRTSTEDALGRLTQVTEGTVGYITEYTYDALSDLTCVEQHGGVTGTGCASSPSNDATSPWHVRRFTYDSLARLITAKNPETGTVTYGYNLDSVLTSKTDNRGITITYNPDVLHRITSKTYSDGEPTISYSYDAFTSGANYCASGTNYGVGRRTGMTDASGSTTWTYDPMGRVCTEAQTIASINKSTSNTYNLDGSVATTTYPSGAVVTVTPGGAGRPLAETDTTHSINYAQSLVYWPTGQVNTGVYGQSSGYAGIAQTNTYNDRGQPMELKACGLSSCTDGSGSQTPYLIDLSYSFGAGTNDNGNVQGITNNKNTARNQNFSYDGLNRVTQAYSVTSWGANFTYDAWGNLYQTSAVSGINTNPMTVNQQMTLTTNQFELLGYVYDAAGNVLSDGVNIGCGSYAYTWNAEQQSTCAAGSTYVYNGDGKRVEKTGGNSTPTLYWGADTLAESNTSGTLTSEYIYLSGKRIARRDISTGNVYYYFSDQLGTSNVVATAAGTVENESDFYPFGGEDVITQNLANQHYKFTGKERDTESGNDYFEARYYASNVGRFLLPDPVKISPGRMANPQQLNLYSYVANNPLRFIDPDGETLQISGNVDEAQKQLCAVIGGDCSRISYNSETHTITVNLEGIDLSKNEGASALHDVINSGSAYSLTLGSQMLTAGGLSSLNPENNPSNLDNKFDSRWPKGKVPQNLPPSGIDDAIGINPSVGRLDASGRVIPLSTRIFHELTEAFAKVDKGMQYDDAHKDALGREATLRSQRPNMQQEGSEANGPVIRDPKPPSK
jgi:RHS repeat-associated protein